MDWITTTTILQDLGDATNQAAWGRVVERLRPPIVRFARRMHLCESECEDVAQETLLTFFERYRAGRYDRAKGRLSQWLFGIALRKSLHQRRANGRRKRIVVGPERSSFWRTLPDAHAASRIWDQEWAQAILERCLRAVRLEVEPQTMRAFELVLRDGRTPAEAARELGVPVKAVYNAKYTVLNRIRARQAALERID